MDQYQIILTFSEPLLGTVPKDAQVYASYIAGLNSDDELETVPEQAEEKGWTGFHEVNGKPILYDYVFKGFFKDACGMMRRSSGSKSSKLSAYKKVIDGLLFVEPRRVPLTLSGPLSLLERPLRASTAQGERVALARSDAAPIGSSCTFTLTVLDGVSLVLLEEWLDYGRFRGLGQWRNGGYGRFHYEMEIA